MLSTVTNRVSQVRSGFAKSNSAILSKISHKLLEEAVFSSDRLLAQLSLVTYALEKLSSRTHIRKNRKWPAVQAKILSLLDSSAEALRFGNVKKFESVLGKIMDETMQLDSSIGRFVVNVVEKAKLKQASTAYALGLSMNKAASLTGADKKELQSYIGVTKIHDEQRGTKSISQRVKELEDFVRA
jgi:predicted XRE-type DNA-binding protein